jgi:hypothetical protein
MFIKVWNFFHGLRTFLSSLGFFNISLPYIYSRPYFYCFCQNFQALHLFTVLRLFPTLEYVEYCCPSHFLCIWHMVIQMCMQCRPSVQRKLFSKPLPLTVDIVLCIYNFEPNQRSF